MLSAVTLRDTELMEHTGKLNEGLTKAKDSIILLTQQSSEHDDKRRSILDNTTSTNETRNVLVRDLESAASRRAADIDKATRTVSLLQSLLQETEATINFLRPRHRIIDEEINHATNMVRAAAGAGNALATPPKRGHSPPAQKLCSKTTTLCWTSQQLCEHRD